MPGHKKQTGRPVRRKRGTERNRPTVVLAASLAFSLIGMGVILARRAPTNLASPRERSNPGSEQGVVSPTALTPANPSKEFIHGPGGRLIATEEPVQSGGGCTFSLSPDNRSFGSAGGSGSFNVTTQSGCNWTAANTAFWFTAVPPSGSGSGNGSVNYTVNANFAYGCRDGTFTVEDKQFTIRESGIPSDSDCDGIPDSVELGESRNPNLKDNDVFNNARLFVMHSIATCCHVRATREASRSGLTLLRPAVRPALRSSTRS